MLAAGAPERHHQVLEAAALIRAHAGVHQRHCAGEKLAHALLLVEIVDDRASFEREVRNGNYQVILSDYKLPAYDGGAALAFAREHRPDIPFILVSGEVGEEAAVGCLVGGATDYVLKGHLAHLIPSLQRALREAEDRQARKRAEEALLSSEQRYRRLFEAAKDGILLLDAVTGHILDANPSVLELLGYTAEQVLGCTPAAVGICGNDAATHAAFMSLSFKPPAPSR